MTYIKRKPLSEETKLKIGKANSTGKKPTREVLHEMYIIKRLAAWRIGELLDVSKPTILKWLKSYDIPIRTSREAAMGNSSHRKADHDPLDNMYQRSKFGRLYKLKVLERDDYTCQICQKRGGNLHIDHIKSWSSYPSLRFDLDNCRTLCVPCHYYVTFKRQINHKSGWGTYGDRRNAYYGSN